jgi:hypothetical protein
VRCITLTVASGIIAGLAIAAAGHLASADESQVTCTRTRSCTITAERSADAGGKSAHPRPRVGRQPDRRNADHDRRLREAGKKLEAAIAAYNRRVVSYNRCVLSFDPSRNPAGCGSAPTLPAVPRFASSNFSGNGNQPIRADQAAAIAVARLQLPTIGPGIGPSPDLNPWNMAAVGYPLWLWADGPTNVGPISDSVAGLSVSLDAEVSSLTFRMGDGHTVTCAGTGHAWTAAVEPGTKSPNCGYSYTKPSLPDRAYTVAAIANWAVTWTSNGQSGVINVPVVDTTELPVGELQVLVR